MHLLFLFVFSDKGSFTSFAYEENKKVHSSKKSIKTRENERDFFK